MPLTGLTDLMAGGGTKIPVHVDKPMAGVRRTQPEDMTHVGE